MNKKLKSFVVGVTLVSMTSVTSVQYVSAAQIPTKFTKNEKTADNLTKSPESNNKSETDYKSTVNDSSLAGVDSTDKKNITNDSNYIFLSDLKVVPSMTQVGWGTLKMDQNTSGNPIKLKRNGKILTFTKGIGAHAISKVTYDLTGYENYTNFVTYAGIDASKDNAGNGAVIKAQVSYDGVHWEDKATSPIQKGNTEAYYININIKGYKYLRLYANDNGNNGSDHVVYGHPRILKEGYDIINEGIQLDKTLAEYDAELRAFGLDTPVSTYENVLYQRTLLSKIGEEQLQLESVVNPALKDTINWLLNDSKVLYYYITGGDHNNGSPVTTLNVLSELYKNVKDDFADVQEGDLYKKLAIAMSLTNTNGTKAVAKYKVYKELYDKNRLFDKAQFKSLPVETMRLATGGIDDIQIPWLNAKVRNYDPDGKIGSLNPYDHMKYKSGYNYKDPKYFSSENFAKWDEKYKLSQYNIPYGDLSYSPFWIMFEEGAVCGGISEAGVALHSSFGIPNVFVAQPGHAAYLTYSKNKSGQGIWSIGNNVSGFKQTRKGGRMPLGWGSDSWNTNYTGSYYLLSQHALNNYDDFIEALDLVLLADVYKDDNSKLQEIYKKALKAQSYNLDAMEGLIAAYKADPTKDSTSYSELAREFGESLKYFPLAMSDMLAFIKRNITDAVEIYNVDMLRTKYLNEALLANSTTSLQPTDCKDIANYILGNAPAQVASFSFDGKDAGKIVMGKQYQNSTFQLRYSLDGGATWEETSDKVVQLSEKQIESITAENNIKLMLVGSTFQYTLEISEGVVPSKKKIYQNDLENKLFGDTGLLEYSLDAGTTWHDYISGVDGTRFSSEDQTVWTRCKATGSSTRSEVSIYEFKASSKEKDNQYISLDRLSVSGFSSQGGNASTVATNVLDGNIYTGWKTAKKEDDNGRYITIEIDEPTYISQMEYIPMNGAGDGTITNANIYVSLDNVKWTQVASNINWEKNSKSKVYRFGDPVYGKYIKIQGAKAHNDFCSASVINLFEDKTQNKNIWFNLKQGKELKLFKGEPYDLEENILDNYGSIHNTNIEPSDFEIKVEKLDELGNVVAVGKGLGRKGDGTLIKSGPYRVTYSLTINGETVSKSITAKVLDTAKPLDYTHIKTGNNSAINNSAKGIGLWDGAKEVYFQPAISMVEKANFTIDVSDTEYGFMTLAYGIKDSVRQNTAWGSYGKVKLQVLADDNLIYESAVLGWKDKYIEPMIEIPYGTKQLKVVNVPVGSGNNHGAVTNIKVHDYQYGINWSDDEIIDGMAVTN